MSISTNAIQKLFPKGKKVRCTIRSCVPFGYFVDIQGTEIRGVIDVLGLKSSEKTSLKVGSTIEAIILDFRYSKEPLRRQFRLAAHPESFEK